MNNNTVLLVPVIIANSSATLNPVVWVTHYAQRSARSGLTENNSFSFVTPSEPAFVPSQISDRICFDRKEVKFNDGV